MSKLSHKKLDAGRAVAQADAMFLSIGEGAIATNAEGRIEKINSVALSLLETNEAALIGRWYLSAVNAFDENGNEIEPMDRPITRAFLTGKPVSERIAYRTAKGKLLPVGVTVSPIILDGEPIGAIEVFRDVTHELEVDRMKSEFISIASHQLRTPLSAIKTYTHLLSEGYTGEMNPEQHQMLDIILDSTQHMNELIDNLLDVARLEGGKMVIDRRTFKLATLIDEIVIALLPIATQKNIVLQHLQSSDPVSINTDPLLVEEICGNLLSNAIKYTPAGGRVTIDTKKTKKQIVVTVTDTGYGIPREAQGKIFTKFFRASNALEHEPQGNGLGLYMAHGVAQQLGGELSFKSVPGKGSTFYLTLPIS